MKVLLYLQDALPINLNHLGGPPGINLPHFPALGPAIGSEIG